MKNKKKKKRRRYQALGQENLIMMMISLTLIRASVDKHADHFFIEKSQHHRFLFCNLFQSIGTSRALQDIMISCMSNTFN